LNKPIDITLKCWLKASRLKTRKSQVLTTTSFNKTPFLTTKKQQIMKGTKMPFEEKPQKVHILFFVLSTDRRELRSG
jgi:hypothetical protein